jgi:mannosyl-3-phosphoglycerate phosphatase
LDTRNKKIKSAPWLVVTDLDGTLLDHHTYDWRPAEPAIRALQKRGDTIALCSSKTRAELEVLARDTGIAGPLIAENGATGQGIEFLREGLRKAASASEAEVRGFGDMSLDEVIEHTGLPRADAALARQREFDEPFLFLSGDEERFAGAVAREGLRLTRGGRFWHVLERGSKGEALQALKPGHSLAIALGDSENDRSMLEAADVAIVIPGGNLQPEAAWRVAPAPGPPGWNAAMMALIAELG